MRLSTTSLCTCAVILAVTFDMTCSVPQKDLSKPLNAGNNPQVYNNRKRPNINGTRPVSRRRGSHVSTAIDQGKRYGSSNRNDVQQYNGNAYNNYNGNGNVVNGNAAVHVTEGHRLITRALWRIFDALMQKKDHSQLYSRMSFVEEALKKMISVDSQLEDEIDKLKDDMVVCKSQLATAVDELSKVKSFNARLEQLEQSLQQQSSSAPEPQGDQLQATWAAAAYSSCPEPFEKVNGECYSLANTEMLGWEDARRECGRLGGDLASPRNLQGLRSYLNSVQSPPEYLWVGGSRTDDGSWVWSSGPMAGVPVDMSKSTWNEEVPHGPGKCMGLFGLSSYRAYNYNCKEKDFFVCQYYF